jgi:predicted nucleotidyltransferase/DNA-binding XRE family transcriptional regulator
MEAKTLLRTERLRAGLTQRELADRTGVPQSTIARIEMGHSDPRASTLNSLLVGCGRSMSVVGWRAHASGGMSERALRHLPEMTRRIAEGFSPSRIILFGSQARGLARPLSDIDLLVVFDSDGDRRERRVAIRTALADLIVDKDILVVTEHEATSPRAGSIIATALTEGVPLYVA